MIDEQTIQTLKQQHGDTLALLTANIGDDEQPDVRSFVVKSPGAEYKRFKRDILDEGKRPAAVENLVRACVVHPDAHTFTELLNRRPALADRLADKVMTLAGGDIEVSVKKL